MKTYKCFMQIAIKTINKTAEETQLTAILESHPDGVNILTIE